ncbi:segregation/condensation protein A [Alkaliphilus pronyensis]|uniref:Segregation and condensation protein A n=1 Tax=Alkaliphilus pronyensis TaxID=1482732 RepID=A0A6I0FDI6_9FIRM|nr:segregation/condensation protein A [Alkaliphilus pronyensis]KAB3532531.1 segregation/condensation protein A [Alkaliphilus pronyensis]
MSYKIKVQAFEGPFDLLFHLIEKNEIDIYDIPISEITVQYIQYIKAMQEIDLNVTSEFLVMVATLLEIKSKMLLPVEKKVDEQLEFEEVDPRNELVRRLLEYKKYKYVADALKSKGDLSSKLFFKPREEIIFDIDDSSNLLEEMDMNKLILAFNKVLKNHGSGSVNVNLRKMERETFTIEEKINAILNTLSTKAKVTFNHLFLKLSSRNEVITTFLALLELIRMKKVGVKQSNCFSEILIEIKSN